MNKPRQCIEQNRQAVKMNTIKTVTVNNTKLA